MWIRHVLVPGITDSKENLENLSDFIKTLKTVEKTEILPYHNMGTSKWEKLGLKYPLDGVGTPTKNEIEDARGILICRGDA